MAANRDWYPDKLSVPPHSNRLDHTPFSQSVISQRDPYQCWPPQTIDINEREGGAQKAEIVVDWFVREVGHDRVSEGGENVEAEYEGC